MLCVYSMFLVWVANREGAESSSFWGDFFSTKVSSFGVSGETPSLMLLVRLLHEFFFY